MKDYAAKSVEVINSVNKYIKDFKFNLTRHSSNESLLHLLDSTIATQETNFKLITRQNTMDKTHSTLKEVGDRVNKETPKKKKQKHQEKVFKAGMSDGSKFSGIGKKDENRHKKEKSASTEYKDSKDSYKLGKSKKERSSLSEALSDTKKIHKYSKNFEIAEVGGSKNHKGYFIIQNEEDDLDIISTSKQPCLLEKDANIEDLNIESATKHKKSKKRHKDSNLLDTDREDSQIKKHKRKRVEDVPIVQIDDVELGDQTQKKIKKKHKDGSHSTGKEDIINLEDYDLKNKKHKRIKDSEDSTIIEDKDAKSNLENQKQRDKYPSSSQTDIEHTEDNQTKKRKRKKDEDVSTVQIDDIKLSDPSPKKKKKKLRDDTHSTANEDIIHLEDYNLKNKKHKKIKDCEDLTVIEDKGSKSNLRNEKKRHSSSKYESLQEQSIKTSKIPKQRGLSKYDNEMKKVKKANSKKKNNKNSDEDELSKAFDTKVESSKEKNLDSKRSLINKEKDNSDIMDAINETFDTSLDATQLSDEDLQTLVNLKIFVPWDIPRSHEIETRISSCPTKVQQQTFQDLDIQMKSGPYTKEEDDKIRENWLQFCKEHDLKPNPLLFFSRKITKKNILSANERLNFVRYLGKGLENRTLYSIYSRFQVLFRNTKKGRFTPEEDNIILAYSEQSDIANRFSFLATVLNRSRECIKKRHELLIASKNKITWDIKLMEDFIKKLIKITGVQDIEQLKDFPIEIQHWKQIEKEMKIPAAKLRLKWISNLYPQLFIEDCNNLYEIRCRLIDKLYDSNRSDRRDINWIEVAEDFPGITATKLSRMFTDMLAHYVPAPIRTDFRACVSYLKEAFKSYRKKGKKLKRLVYTNGRLRKAKKRIR